MNPKDLENLLVERLLVGINTQMSPEEREELINKALPVILNRSASRFAEQADTNKLEGLGNPEDLEKTITALAHEPLFKGIFKEELDRYALELAETVKSRLQ